MWKDIVREMGRAKEEDDVFEEAPISKYSVF